MSSEKVKTINGDGNGSGGESLIAADYGRQKSTCGYSKSPARSSISRDPGLSAETLTVNDYQAFWIYDKEHSSGFVSATKLRRFVMTDQQLTIAEVDELIKEADIDGDGHINHEEFFQLFMAKKRYNAETEQIHELTFEVSEETVVDIESPTRCRICITDKKKKTLMELGFSCKGELALAHKKCAKKWFTNKRTTICEVCNTATNVEIKVRGPLWRYYLVMYLSLFLIFCVILSVLEFVFHFVSY